MSPSVIGLSFSYGIQAMTSIFGATLVRLRRFLSLVQIAPYTVPVEVQKMVEEDFVAARADDERVS